MKVKREHQSKIIAKGIFCFMLGSILFCISLMLCYVFTTQLPKAVEISNADGVGITMGHVSEFSDKKLILGAATFEESFIRTDSGAKQHVKAITSNAAYMQLLQLQFITGAQFFNNNEVARYVVLPQTIAIKLYQTANVIGKEINIGGEYYTICGVYAYKQNFLDEISSNELSRAYLSRPISEPYASIMAKELLVADSDNRSADYIKARIELKCGIGIGGNIHDLRAPLLLARFIVYISFLFMLSLPIFWLLRYSCRGIYSLYGIEIDCVYIAKILKHMLAICTVAGALLFLLNKINIPSIYLPPDNIFDLTFYRKLFVSFFIQMNTQIGIQSYYQCIAAYLQCIALVAFTSAIFIRKGLRQLRAYFIAT